jgi:DNA end-binding protein Ku
MRYHDPELGEVERADLVKGYQFEKDKYVIIEKEELEAIQIESNKTIDIEGFVEASDIDDLYLDSPYYLGPDGPVAEETYAVIREALERTGKVAIARVVLSSRERLIALQPYGHGMSLTTLRTAKEVRDAEHYFEELDVELNDELLGMAEMIINSKAMEFDPSTFEDRYETALMELVKAKVAGKEPVVSKAPEQGKVVNLMDALKASLEDDRAPAAASKPKAKSKPAAKAKKPAKKKTG